MKTFIYIALFAFMLPATSQAAMPAGCLPEYNYSPLNGQRCVDAPRVECATGDLFSYLTGQPCGVVEVSEEEVNTPTQESAPTPVVTPTKKGVLSIAGGGNAFQIGLSNTSQGQNQLSVVAPDGLKLFESKQTCEKTADKGTVCGDTKWFALEEAKIGNMPIIPLGNYEFKITAFGKEYIKTVVKNNLEYINIVEIDAY